MNHALAAFSAAGGEGWPSGRRGGTGNAVYGQLYRGFESHPLRHLLVSDVPTSDVLMFAQPQTLSVGEKGPDARRRAKAAREGVLSVRRACGPERQRSRWPLLAHRRRLAVLDGEVAVPCNPQSAIAGLNSLLEGRLC